MNTSTRLSAQKGQVLILALMITGIFLLLTAGLLTFTGAEFFFTKRSYQTKQAVSLAEAGLNKAIQSLNEDINYTGEESSDLNTGTFEVAVTGSGNNRTIESTAYIPDKESPQITKKLRIKANITTTNIGFHYGVQVGDGGLVMSNNSRIKGSVYSNGNIQGGKQGSAIDGDAFVAGAAPGAVNTKMDSVEVGGSGHANTINKATVGGNVHCRTLSKSTVGGNAYCDTISGSTIGGQIFPGEPDPAHLDLPISDTNILDWKDDASGGQIINGDYNPPINSTNSLGPAKITGNLLMKNNQTLILTGTIWVVGNIEIDQNSKIELSPSYGANSGVILSDGWQHFANNGVFKGSGTAGSYILMLSTAIGGGHHDSAIDLHNGVDATIFYAQNGLVNIHQKVQVKEITAYKLRLEENAQVIYEQGLQNAKFTSGPGGGFEFVKGSYQEIK